MLSFKTTRCPYCNLPLSVMKPYGINDYENFLGKPTGYCPGCKGTYTTGRQIWSKMNFFMKSIVMLQLLFSICLTSLLVSCFLLLGLHELRIYIFKNSINWIENNSFPFLMLITGLILLPIIATLIGIRFIEDVKELESQSKQNLN